MLYVEEGDIDRITAAIYLLLKGQIPAPIEFPPDYPDNEVKQLAQYVNSFVAQYLEFAEHLFSLCCGNLDDAIPRSRLHVTQFLKNLQANLRHLAWKTEQVAKGDFSQRVDFMGEFSKNFNSMVEQLASNREELLLKNQELETASRTDSLTGLLNRRGVRDILDREGQRSERSRRPFVVTIADIDHFKAINDTYGHDAGDQVLAETANTFLRNLRKVDVCARWGGEEFLLLLLDTTIPQGLASLERVRLAVEHMAVVHGDMTIHLTISAGVSVCQPGEDIEACLKRSDSCLYRAKEAGRNRIWVQESPEVPARPLSW